MDLSTGKMKKIKNISNSRCSSIFAGILLLLDGDISVIINEMERGISE